MRYVILIENLEREELEEMEAGQSDRNVLGESDCHISVLGFHLHPDGAEHWKKARKGDKKQKLPLPLP